MSGCSVGNCGRPHYAKGFCNSHWARSRRGHDLNRPLNRKEWPFAGRLWAKVARRGPDDCWLWSGATIKGYGAFGISGRQTYSHRAAYMLEHGEIPVGMVVRHRCDTPLCCNPAHLVLGTHKDNSADAVSRGRHAHGERSGNARLSVEQVDYIRKSYRPRDPVYGAKALAKRFGVTHGAVSMAASGKTWRSA